MKRILLILPLILLFGCKKDDPDPNPVVTMIGSISWKSDGIQNTSHSILYSNYVGVGIMTGDTINRNTLLINIQFWSVDSTYYEMGVPYDTYHSISSWGDTIPTRTSYGIDTIDAEILISNVDTVNKVFSGTFHSKNGFPLDTGITWITEGVITNAKYTMD